MNEQAAIIKRMTGEQFKRFRELTSSGLQLSEAIEIMEAGGSLTAEQIRILQAPFPTPSNR